MKKRMRLNLMAGSAAVFLIMFFVTVGFMVLSFFTFRDHVKLRMWAGCLAVGILLLLFALFLFILYGTKSPFHSLRVVEGFEIFSRSFL